MELKLKRSPDQAWSGLFLLARTFFVDAQRVR